MIVRRDIMALGLVACVIPAAPAFAADGGSEVSNPFSPALLAISRVVFTSAQAAPLDPALFVPHATSREAAMLRPRVPQTVGTTSAFEGPLSLRGRLGDVSGASRAIVNAR